MLAICRRARRRAGVELTLHHADWTSFDLPRRYATIYNPAGSFSLIARRRQAREPLSTWMRHLAPGGRLLIVMGIPRADFGAEWEWKVRRSATRVAATASTFMVHEALRCDVDAQIEHVLHRHEVWDADGQLVTTFMRRHRLRWWTPISSKNCCASAVRLAYACSEPTTSSSWSPTRPEPPTAARAT